MFDRVSSGIGLALQKILGSHNQRVLDSLKPLVRAINAKEPEYERLADGELAARTAAFRERVANGQSLDDLLPDAFAMTREAAKRTLGMRLFDVQLMGGIVLHQGKIAEMATGEGKTLAATAPAYLNALAGKSVYLVTVNDYLARRDREWMGPVYELLGLRVAAIQAGMSSAERLEVYGADITYGTNNEFGFDYLRDNMKMSADQQVQRHLHFAIIDEVDSILIDEARTPLIISGLPEASTSRYVQADRIARRLMEGRDFEKKEKEHVCPLTDEGVERAQELAGVDSFYSGTTMDWPHHIEQALRANHLFKKDRDYVVAGTGAGAEVVIVDEFTGRLMTGRRWSDGLHQAVEAKEGIAIKEESQTLATITFQNYFRLYDKIAGMTGTAVTEAAEFLKIYGLEVVSIPTNLPMIRRDRNDVVFRTLGEKRQAIIDEICRLHAAGRPVLVGTTSIENSEVLSEMLSRRGVQHEVLNAKHHEREAAIIAKAGEYGQVTIATNMAGRGTDIKLGPGVLHAPCFDAATGKIHGCVKGAGGNGNGGAAPRGRRRVPVCEDETPCGLHVIGTERHEARRIDNQLRGRSARQGDPGASRFFLSLDDDLMRIFARDWVKAVLEKLGMTEGQEIESRLVTRGIENAQKRVEARNFEIRKNLLEYDEVMDAQRRTIYGMRQRILEGEDLKDDILSMVRETIENLVETYLASPEAAPDFDGLADRLNAVLGTQLIADDFSGLDRRGVEKTAMDAADLCYREREEDVGPAEMRRIERFLLLSIVDARWKDHLYAMDALKAGISLRAYAQTDPKLEYKKEGYAMFRMLLQSISEGVAGLVFKLRVRREEEAELKERWHPGERVRGESPDLAARRRGIEQAAAAAGAGTAVAQIRRRAPKVGRNDPCPCGSGRKYKKCCGAGA